tara:strand:- start:4522 stop:4827 length:306 start_codon:yes stop_codon:yes gene_type:complete
MQSRTLSVPAATSVTQTVRFPALEHGYDLREDHAQPKSGPRNTRPKVIPQPVDTQSSAEHLIGVKTMSAAFRVSWVGWAVAQHSKNNSAHSLKVLTGMPIT